MLQIKPHAPPLVQVPVNSFEFHSFERTPQVEYLLRLLRHRSHMEATTPSIHRLRRGLPGYLILFAPTLFRGPQCQLQSSEPPSPLVFLLISTHFTATLRFLTPPALQPYSFKAVPGLSPGFSLLTCMYLLLTPSKSG